MKFDFSDINLVPKKCIVSSRSQCDTSLQFGKYKFNIPIVPSNMECVIDYDIAQTLSTNGYFYIMHRFGDTYEFIKKMKILNLPISISIGVNKDSYELLENLYNQNLIPDYITIDIAHGHSISTESMLKYLKSRFPDTFVIAGNISTPDAVVDLERWGADATKVGIGPGCFIPSSEVKTNNGLVKIKDIKIDDYVLTHKNRFKKVIDIQTYTGEQDLLVINDMPACTQSHEFFVIEKDKKQLVNDYNISEYGFWVKAEHLDSEKHLLVKM